MSTRGLIAAGSFRAEVRENLVDADAPAPIASPPALTFKPGESGKAAVRMARWIYNRWGEMGPWAEVTTATAG